MMGMWQYPSMVPQVPQMPQMPQMPMSHASMLPGMGLPLPTPTGCGCMPSQGMGGAGFMAPAITESQRKYMSQIVLGMKSSDISIVASSLSNAVKEKVQIPDAFLATVKQWMASRQESVAASSQMQLAQFIGAQAWTNQVQANMQLLAQPGQSIPPDGASAPVSASFPSAPPTASPTHEDAAPVSGAGDSALPETLGESPLPGGRTPALTGAQTPTVVPTDSLPVPTNSLRSITQGTATASTISVPPPTDSVPSEPSARPAIQARREQDDEPPVPQVRRRHESRPVERSAQEIADFIRSLEKDSASFRHLRVGLRPCDMEQLREAVAAHPELFSVEDDIVTLKDTQRKEALTSLIKQLVTAEMQRSEIAPQKAMDAIWSAAHFALKATPAEVIKVFQTVSSAVLRKKDKVPKGWYPANMTLALACIIDRAVYLARRDQLSVLEKALGPHLHDILLSRLKSGSPEESGSPGDQDLEPCKQQLLVLLAFARPEGVPDPPHKDDGTGWYKVVARDPGEDKDTEPICSHERLQALERVRREEREVPGVPDVPDLPAEPEKLEAPAEARQRAMHAAAQMGLGKEPEGALPVKRHSAEPPEVHNDSDEEALFGSAVFDSAVFSEEEIFGSPHETDEEGQARSQDAQATGKADTLANDSATQPYASQDINALPATQLYQDEPPSKRPRLSGAELASNG
ncbi:unnamed protein product [Effrenium voratum]|uniref:Uncharacterized protein n=1 Tax=Effrenium voratum TaxID=2562239 RepID=A0AA36NDZ7_9DINO|nr:unnamed protein product [Effrenium voratum]